MLILKKNGTQQRFDEKKIEKIIVLRSGGLEIDQGKVLEELKKNIAEGISTRDLEKMLVLTCASLSEVSLDYDKLATRIFLQRIYKEVLGPTQDEDFRRLRHRDVFVSLINTYPRYDARLKSFDLKLLSSYLDISRDEKFGFMGLTNLYEKLLARDEDGTLRETPQMFWMRVAMGLSMYDTKDFTFDLYTTLSTHQGISSTPTLFYSGMATAQLSSCGGTVIADTTESIFAGVADNFTLGKWSYGIGTSVSKLRAIGSPVKSTGIVSSGIIPFLKIYNDVAAAVNRGGRKRGAMQFTLENWHYETEDFIKLRRNAGDEHMRTHDINTALFISDEFMKRVQANEEWMLVDPKEAKDLGHDLTELSGNNFAESYKALEAKARAGEVKLFKFVKAKDLWKQQLVALFETGHPWVTFKDAMNMRNPNAHTGMIYSTNLCTEIAQNSEANEDGTGQYFNCFLASINLSEMYDPVTIFNSKKLRETIRTLVRSLDNANDLNYYPIFGVEAGANRYRSIGIGMLGFQDLLFKCRIPYDSPRAVNLLDCLTEAWSYFTIEASAELAEERGSYPEFKGSHWSMGILPLHTLVLLGLSREREIDTDLHQRMDWFGLREQVKKGLRNGYLMSPAPNASTAIYLGVYPCTEPQYANIYAKENMLGKFSVINSYLVKDLTEKYGMEATSEIIRKLKLFGGDLKKAGVKDEELLDLYRGAFEVNPMAQVEHAKVMAKWIDQSHARNVFLDGNSGKVLNDLYMAGWAGGVKTFYYLRSRAATQTEKSTE